MVLKVVATPHTLLATSPARTVIGPYDRDEPSADPCTVRLTASRCCMKRLRNHTQFGPLDVCKGTLHASRGAYYERRPVPLLTIGVNAFSRSS